MRELPVFKARCSQLATIMTPLVGGLTEKQREQLDIYIKREADFKAGVDKVKDLTPTMREDMNTLIEKRNTPPRLSDGVISYLKSWYASAMYDDYQDDKNKYTIKGTEKEGEAIEILSEHLGYGCDISKNEEFFENEWICGTPDIILDSEIIDIKCPFNSTTFLDAVNSNASDMYRMQLNAYMWLTGKRMSRLAFCLVNTPAYLTSKGEEVCYDHIPLKYRVHFKDVYWEDTFPSMVSERVEMCRDYIEKYHSIQCLIFE